jgi:hypothetical protein
MRVFRRLLLLRLHQAEGPLRELYAHVQYLQPVNAGFFVVTGLRCSTWEKRQNPWQTEFSITMAGPSPTRSDASSAWNAPAYAAPKRAKSWERL